jgi:transglutaminase-like putative cysteine protease
MRALNTVIGALAILCAGAGGVHAETDLKALATSITASAHTNTERVTAVIGWAHSNLDWLSTDYQKRSVLEILDRKGGNCDEDARVVVALLDELGVKNRRVQEINIQPDSSMREKDAEELIATNGPSASIFGLHHNDHVWVEYWDEQHTEWAPADPTLSLVGYDQWIKARVGFAERITSNVIPSRDMIVPIAIFALTPGPQGSTREYRGERYLVTGFAAVIPAAARSPAWAQWKSELEAFQPKAKAAFEGAHNLHEDTDAIAALRATYQSLKTSATTHTTIGTPSRSMN